jgi:hypothetical protein
MSRHERIESPGFSVASCASRSRIAHLLSQARINLFDFAAHIREQPIHRAEAPIDGVVRVIAKRTVIGTLTLGESAAISLTPDPIPVLRASFSFFIEVCKMTPLSTIRSGLLASCAVVLVACGGGGGSDSAGSSPQTGTATIPVATPAVSTPTPALLLNT